MDENIARWLEYADADYSTAEFLYAYRGDSLCGTVGVPHKLSPRYAVALFEQKRLVRDGRGVSRFS